MPFLPVLLTLQAGRCCSPEQSVLLHPGPTQGERGRGLRAASQAPLVHSPAKEGWWAKAAESLSRQGRGNILILFSCADAAISKPDLLTRIEQGEDPNAEDQEDSEGGETPTDPTTGEPRGSWDLGRWRQMWGCSVLSALSSGAGGLCFPACLPPDASLSPGIL